MEGSALERWKISHTLIVLRISQERSFFHEYLGYRQFLIRSYLLPKDRVNIFYLIPVNMQWRFTVLQPKMIGRGRFEDNSAGFIWYLRGSIPLASAC
jgi:hypothetical protein